VVVGDNDADMMKAIEELKRIQGGITIVHNGSIVESLPLEIAGIMTNQDIDTVCEKLKKMEHEARQLGVTKQVDDPFLSLAFMSLPVIPDLKLTDRGLFDVTTFSPTEIEVE